jgi:hypothetical protein
MEGWGEGGRKGVTVEPSFSQMQEWREVELLCLRFVRLEEGRRRAMVAAVEAHAHRASLVHGIISRPKET